MKSGNKLSLTSYFNYYFPLLAFLIMRGETEGRHSSQAEYSINLMASFLCRGEKITILYDPGMFPALGTKKEMRNGGVPQEGNLTKHLEIYRLHVDELVPDVNNTGLIIIDFESWRPIFRQNWGVLAAYKDTSYQIERQRHPFWQKQRQQAEVRPNCIL